MLYLLMTLYYQNKSISLSSFTIPKVRLQPTPDVGSVMISHVDPRQGHSPLPNPFLHRPQALSFFRYATVSSLE